MTKAKTAAIVWTLVILALCWMPRTRLPLREDAPSLLNRLHVDKFVHAGIFAVFALLWRRSGTEKSMPMIVILGILLAIVTELGQGTAFVGRDPDVWDGLVDILGIPLGLVAASVTKPRPEESSAAAAILGLNGVE